MEIAEQLNLLKQIKLDIKTAIQIKGVEVSNNTPFSSYPELIGRISGGGGSGGDILIKEYVQRNIEEEVHIAKGWVLDGTFTDGYNPQLQPQVTLEGASDRRFIMNVSSNDLQNANSWEFRTRFQESANTRSGYIASLSSLGAYIYRDGYEIKFRIDLDSSGTNNIVLTIPRNSYIVNRYLKVGFTGEEYYLSYNDSGWDSTFTTMTSSSNNKGYAYNMNNVLLNHPTSSSNFRQYIYAAETSLYTNGQLYWELMKPNWII